MTSTTLSHSCPASATSHGCALVPELPASLGSARPRQTAGVPELEQSCALLQSAPAALPGGDGVPSDCFCLFSPSSGGVREERIVNISPLTVLSLRRSPAPNWWRASLPRDCSQFLCFHRLLQSEYGFPSPPVPSFISWGTVMIDGPTFLSRPPSQPTPGAVLAAGG